MWKIIFVVLFISFFSACKKDSIEADWQKIDSGTQNYLYGLSIVNDTLYAVGGSTYSKGELAKIQLNNNNLMQCDSIGPKAVYDALLLNSGVFQACGYDGILYNSSSFGNNLNVIQTNLWSPLQKISRGNDWSVSVGGGGERSGVICVQEDTTWRRTELRFNNELRAVCVLNNTTAIAAGSGIVLKTIDRGKTWQALNIDGDFFTDMQKIGNTIYLLGSSGLLFKSTNEGRNWDKIKIQKSPLLNRAFLNSLYFVDSNNGFICGNKGTVLVTANGGKNWQQFKGLDDTDFWDIIYHANNNSIYACGSNGVIVQIRY
jgi:hypothetical protein